MPDPALNPYRQNQMRLLSLDLSDMVPANHMARVVDEAVESLDLSALRSLYPGGGAPAHDPRMMLEVIVYAYASGVCSSRKISEATRSNVYFLWLTGCTALDHMTVNRFRTERLSGAFEDKALKKAKRLVEKDHLPRMRRYERDLADMGGRSRRLAFERERKDVSELGYESTARVCGRPDCSGCAIAGRCLKQGRENRRIYVNPHRDELRRKAAERLTSDEGAVLRRRRSTGVETVFGDVKRNWGFRRFTLRGIEKVAHEWRLLMMGHNIRKLARKVAEAAANPEPATA